jgi:N-acetylneuraminic acid mutarotase
MGKGILSENRRFEMSLERMTNRATQIISLLALISLLPLAAAFPVYADGTWTKKPPFCFWGPCPSARYGQAMAWLGGDKVLLFGGQDEATHYGDTWVYDLSENSWVKKWPASAPSGRAFHAMAPLGGDQVLLFGGNGGATNYGDTWVYDLSENSWTNQSPAGAPSARGYHAMAWLGGDQVLLFGGFDDDGHDDETWVYDLSENSWTNQSPAGAPFARYGHAMAWLGGDQALLFGGYDDQTWVYDLSENSWTNQSPAGAPSARYGHAMAWLGGDQVLLFGGGISLIGPFDDETWVYDLSENRWTNQSPIGAPSARGYHAMAWLGGDQVLLFGGACGHYPDLTFDGETWVATGFFTPARTYLPLVMRNY